MPRQQDRAGLHPLVIPLARPAAAAGGTAAREGVLGMLRLPGAADGDSLPLVRVQGPPGERGRSGGGERERKRERERESERERERAPVGEDAEGRSAEADTGFLSLSRSGRALLTRHVLPGATSVPSASVAVCEIVRNRT
jgi:hypothetical protein